MYTKAHTDIFEQMTEETSEMWWKKLHATVITNLKQRKK